MLPGLLAQMTKAQAHQEVWSAIYATLENDLNGVAAAWIYGDDGEERSMDSFKIEAAARTVLEQLRRKANRK